MNKYISLLLSSLLLGGCMEGGKYMSTGSGFLVGDEGYLLTNRHVVKRCSRYQVYGNGIQSEAVLVAYDDDADLALLRLPAAAKGARQGARLSSFLLPLRTWDQLAIIGFPGGRRSPVMTRASLLDLRGPRGEAGLMQFSNSIEKGNSGGPLLDASGNVVGVVVAKSTRTRIESNFWPGRDIEHSDVAITLEAVEKFLHKQQVRYTVSDASETLSDGRIFGKSINFIVNIQCVIE